MPTSFGSLALSPSLVAVARELGYYLTNWPSHEIIEEARRSLGR